MESKAGRPKAKGIEKAHGDLVPTAKQRSIRLSWFFSYGTIDALLERKGTSGFVCCVACPVPWQSGREVRARAGAGLVGVGAAAGGDEGDAVYLVCCLLGVVGTIPLAVCSVCHSCGGECVRASCHLFPLIVHIVSFMRT